MPATWMRTPLGLFTPAATRWKCDDVVTTARGTTPSSNTRPVS